MGEYLTNDEILESISLYVTNNIYNYAMLIDGECGSGKTYFIKKIVVPFLKQMERETKPIYISLYGVESTVDVSNQLYISAITKQDEKNQEKDSVVKKVFSSGMKIASDFLKNKGLNLEDYEKIIGEFIDLSNCVLIFDDLERCNCDINELLGYINNFVEHDGVKVILVANQKEIGKWKEEQNIELKYLLAQSKDINFELEPPKDIFGNIINDNDKVDLDKLKKRANKVFGQNLRYEKIKEKLIGQTIKYYPNINEVNEKLINDNIQNKDLKKILFDLKEIYIEFSKSKNHINFRTFQFFLEKANTIFAIINKDEFKIIQKNILEYIYKICVIYKSGTYKNSWEENSDWASVHLSDIFNFTDYILGFKFIDEFIIHSKLNQNIVEDVLHRYLDEEAKKGLNPNDPVGKVSRWWEREEKDIRKNIEEIIDFIKNDKYAIAIYPNIIYHMASLVSFGFEESILNDTVELMQKKIETNVSVDAFNREDFILEDGKTKELYKLSIQKLKEPLEKRLQESKKNQFDNLIEDESNWGINIYEYYMENKHLSSTEKSFIYLLDMEKLADKISKSNNENVCMFRYAVYKLYDFSNIKDYYKRDKNNIKILIDKIKDMDKGNFDLLKKKNLEMLLELLEKKYEILNN